MQIKEQGRLIEEQNGRTATLDEIAQALEIPFEKLVKLLDKGIMIY